MNIITISREFGSGGREVGKRLADVLGYAYYDREIETEIAERMHMDVEAIKKIDAGRSQYHAMFLDIEWGNKEFYHLCVNTSGLEIKKIVPHIAGYARDWFESSHR